MNRNLRNLIFTVPGVVLGAVGMWSCGNAGAIPGLDDIAKTCGFVCPADGQHVADGKVFVSGVVSVDAFFSSVTRFQTTADGISDGIQAELDAIATSVGAKAGD